MEVLETIKKAHRWELCILKSNLGVIAICLTNWQVYYYPTVTQEDDGSYTVRIPDVKIDLRFKAYLKSNAELLYLTLRYYQRVNELTVKSSTVKNTLINRAITGIKNQLQELKRGKDGN